LETLGENLKRLRLKYGVSVVQVAASTNIHPNYLQRMENERQKNPGLDILVKLADFYGISIDALVVHKLNKDPKANWWLPGKKK
jgi:transcriptional regulator with XRE-family HTH domain